MKIIFGSCAVVPHGILESDLSDTAVRLYAALSIAKESSFPILSISYMAGASISRIKRSFSELESAGWIVMNDGDLIVRIEPPRHQPEVTMLKTALKQERQRERERVNDARESFDLFWSAWPRYPNRPKVGKEPAIREWLKINPDPDLVANILEAVSAWSKSEAWNNEGGKYCPHARTWLHNKRWQDERPNDEGTQTRIKKVSL